MKTTLTLLLCLVWSAAYGQWSDVGTNEPSARVWVNFYDGVDTNLPPAGWPSSSRTVPDPLFVVDAEPTYDTNLLELTPLIFHWEQNTSTTNYGTGRAWQTNMFRTNYTANRTADQAGYDAWESGLLFTTETTHLTNYLEKISNIEARLNRQARTNQNINAYVEGFSAGDRHSFVDDLIKLELYNRKVFLILARDNEP